MRPEPAAQAPWSAGPGPAANGVPAGDPREPLALITEPGVVTPHVDAAVAVAARPAPMGARPVGPADDGEREHLRAAARIVQPADGPGREPGRPAEVGSPEGGDLRASCTVAQLRRFIKSRPWVPMHELRRRFGINGGEDDVTPIRVGGQRLYVGLPPAEGHLVAELLGGGDVGYELSLDPDVPVVVGVYPMRPVPRT